VKAEAVQNVTGLRDQSVVAKRNTIVFNIR